MPAPGVIRNASIEIESVEYAGTCKIARIVPDTTVQSYPTLIPSGVKTDVSTPVWTLELEGVQDHTTGGLAKVLTDNHGQQLTAVLAPFNETGERQATVTFVAQAQPFGGETGEYADFSTELGIVGQPVWADVT